MGNEVAPETFHDEDEPGWSRRYGGSDGQMFQSMSNNHKITDVILYGGKYPWISGIKFKVGDDWKDIIGDVGERHQQQLYLRKSEYINKVKVMCHEMSARINQIVIITNNDRCISIGYHPAAFDHLDGGGNKALIDCRGRTGDYGIKQIQFKWAEPDAETLREIQNEKRIKREREEAEQKERERQKAIANMQQQQQTMNNQRTQIMKMSKKKARQKNKNNEKLLDITNNKLKQNELD
eukprot:541479_1